MRAWPIISARTRSRTPRRSLAKPAVTRKAGWVCKCPATAFTCQDWPEICASLERGAALDMLKQGRRVRECSVTSLAAAFPSGGGRSVFSSAVVVA